MTFNIPLFFIYSGHLSLKRISKGGNVIAAVCLSPCPSPTTREPPVIFSGHHFQPNLDSPIWRDPEEPNLSLLPATNESHEGRLFKAPPLNLRDRKLFPFRRSPHPKILRRGVISLGQGAVPCKREQGRKLRAHRLNRAVPGSLTRALSSAIPGAVSGAASAASGATAATF